VAAGQRTAFGWSRAARVGAAALAALGLAWVATRFWGPVPRPARPPVVAVLPVTNLTGQPEYDATAVGIAEVLVTGLTGIDGIQVLSRLATTGYRDRKGDLPAIARELDAVYLVDGVLQRSEQQLRVSFTLVQLPTNVVRWSGTFDGAFPQLFELQSRVAAGVSGALRVSVTPPEQERIEARPTASPSAWAEYTAALTLLDRQDRPGNVAAAVDRLESALRADPRFARAHAALARAFQARYRETGDASWADRARDSAQEALRLEPGDVEVRRSLARILADRGRLTEAIEELKRAAALKPEADETPRLLSEVLVDAGQKDAALEQARGAVALRPGYAPNHRALGWVHFAAGRFLDAATSYRRAAELQPDNAWAHQMLGTSLHAAGDLAGAVAPYEEAIRLAPDARAWANLGLVYYATGRPADAVRAYEEAARLEPTSGTIRRSLGDVRARAGGPSAAEGDWKAAIVLSREALRVNPRDALQLANVAICLAKIGQKDAALGAARAALEAAPSSADAHYGAAVVHALAGDAPGALAALERALAMGASASLAKDDEDLASLRALPGFRKLLEGALSPPKEVNHAS
jgi:tetratricopeptide (TPR) repeat protein